MISVNIHIRRRLSVLRESVINKYQIVSRKIVSRLHPTNLDRLDDLFKYVTSCYAISASSVEDYINHDEPSRFRKIIAWTCELLLWTITFSAIWGYYFTKRYADDSYEMELALKITGLPGGFVPGKPLIILTGGLAALIAATSRILTLVLEKKHQLEGLEIAFSVRYGEEKGKLNQEYYLKVCFLVELYVNYLLKAYKVADVLVPFVVLSLATLYSFLTPDVTFSYTMIIGCFFWTLIVWLGGTILFCGFAAYFGSVIVLMYRFKQVNERIKYCGSNMKMLVSAIDEHHEICSINERNNRLLSLILFEIYYGVSVVFDIAMVQIIYLDTIPIVKLVYSACSIVLIPMLYSLTYLSARLDKLSRGSYKDLNSMIAREMNPQCKPRFQNIPLDVKLKMINLIERMAQTSITVWCLDLFPLNSFEFYLLIAATAKNFFLFVDLIGK